VPVPLGKEVDRDVAHQLLAHYEAYVKEARAQEPACCRWDVRVRYRCAALRLSYQQRRLLRTSTARCLSDDLGGLLGLSLVPARLTKCLPTLPHQTVPQADSRKGKQAAALLRPRTGRRAPAAGTEREEAGAERPSSAGHASDVDGAVLPSVCHDTLPGQRMLK